MKTIELTQGYVTVVDDEDYERLGGFGWRVQRTRSGVYAAYLSKGVMHYLHRDIMLAPKGLQVDHIDTDRLNNRRSNLRLCDNSENNRNRNRQSNNTSGVKGVSWDRRKGKWQVHIKLHGKSMHLGRYRDLTEAAAVYAEASARLHGEFARVDAGGLVCET